MSMTEAYSKRLQRGSRSVTGSRRLGDIDSRNLTEGLCTQERDRPGAARRFV